MGESDQPTQDADAEAPECMINECTEEGYSKIVGNLSGFKIKGWLCKKHTPDVITAYSIGPHA